MLLDGTTGWGDWTVIEPDPFLSDPARVWTLREVVDAVAPAIEVLGEPGTVSIDAGNAKTVLALILEEITGQSLFDLSRDRVSEPAGLGETGLVTTSVPDGTRAGVFAFEGTQVATSDFDGTAYISFNQAHAGAVATPTDLLDLLDVWESGELFTTDRTPAPNRYPLEGPNPAYRGGIGVPFTGFCPCTPVEGGVETTAFGRAPQGLGTSVAMLRFPDGISVVLNLNSNGGEPSLDPISLAFELHDLAAASR
jgi:CubicO group peptidase (beta-lactamase class C family)